MEPVRARLLAVATLLGAAAAAAHAAQPRDELRVLRTTLRRPGDDGVHTYRIPGLVTTPRGTLVAVFDVRNAASADLPGDVDVGMMRSTDDGATWSAMRRILDYDKAAPGSHGNGVGDPSLLVDATTGAIVVAALWSYGPRAWKDSGPGLTPEETGQLVVARSLDDGLTWSKPVSITPQVKDPAWRLCFQGPGTGIQLRDGTLVFPAQFKGADDVPHACFIASADHGATWRISPPAIPGLPPTSESAIAELTDGALLLSMRDESRSGQRAWARWERSGPLLEGRWSAPWHAAADPTCMASLVRHPTGALVLSNPDDPKERRKLTIRTSADSGRTWSVGRVLEPGAAAYSALAVLRDGRLGVLYERGPEYSLAFARFPLDWVLAR